MSSEEFERVLNFLKIDRNNNIKLLGADDYELEMIEFLATLSQYESESLDGILLKFFKKNILPTIQDLKMMIDHSKQFHKFTLSDKKKLYETINRILATDYKETFIFNKQNIQDATKILTFSFNDNIKKYKINTIQDLHSKVKKINFEKYNFEKLYLNNDYVKSKRKSTCASVNTTSTSRLTSKRTTISSNISSHDDYSEIDDSNKIYINRCTNIPTGVVYIDNDIRNVMSSSTITPDYDYNEEEMSKKLLTKECFTYPQVQSKENIGQTELPIELIILLYKLRNVKSLIFQVNDVDEDFTKMSIFVFLNIKCLFKHEIEEIKFDLGNEVIQKNLNNVFSQRAFELYHFFQKTIYATYYDGSYKARTINCWEPECDIFFEEKKSKKNNEKNSNYIYNSQPNKEGCTFDNNLCNIYNEFGNLTNLKYIRPIDYNIMNINYENQLEKKAEEYDINDHYLSGDIFPRTDRESVYVSSNTLTNKNNLVNQEQSEQNNNSETTTPMLLKKFVIENKYFFKMITIYCYFLWKEFRKLKKLGLYFDTPYSSEIQTMLKLFGTVYDRFHFLIFTCKLSNLKEVSFSFNSLDNKSFESIIGLINKNSEITSLKMSFFTPDINYYDNGLFNLWSSKKLSIRKLFKEQKDFLTEHHYDKQRNIVYFTLHHKQFLDSFEKNLTNFYNLLKTKSFNNLDELVLRFDIPTQILISEKYITLLVKFIINVLIMITFQDNHIHTLKLLSPELCFNSCKMPYIRQLFKEICYKEEKIDEKVDEKIKTEKKRKEKLRIKEKEKLLKEKENEQKLKEKELEEKNVRKDILKNINSNKNNDLKTDDGIDNFDIDENLENFDYTKRFNSMVNKKKNNIEKEVKLETPKDIKNANFERNELNDNESLQNIVIQFKIYNLPEIFNFCLKNNLSGLKTINFGYLDEITFIGFLEDYKLNANKLESLTSLKISLCNSVISYTRLEKYIIEYININTPKLEEKFLFSNLKIDLETKMSELVDLVYYKAVVPKLVVQINNGSDNEHNLSKVIEEKLKNIKKNLNSIILVMQKPEFKKIFNSGIIGCLASFYSKKINRAILCNEEPKPQYN